MAYLSCVTKRVPLLLALLLLLFSGGCGNKDLGAVTGTITLDDQPLADAFVEFTPTGEGGSPSYGKTDANGKYEMEFSRDQSGAWIGANSVRITTEDVQDVDGEEVNVAEKVPAQYNTDSTLTADVQPGSNTFDFPLKSGG